MRWTIETPKGAIPILADDEAHPTVCILAHGAGSHMEHKTMERLSALLRQADVRVIRFNFLYRAQGKGMPDRMPVLTSTYRAVIESVRQRFSPDRLIIGGHSMGGRAASMLSAEETVADGLILFGYPLHPPGQPEKLRDGHLASIKTPTLQMNGTQDEFCTPEIMERIAEGLDRSVWTLHWITGADHSYAVKRSTGRTSADVDSDILTTLSRWLNAL